MVRFKVGEGWIKKLVTNGLLTHVGDHIMGHFWTWFVILALVIDVLEVVEEDGLHLKQRAEACVLINVLQSFDFAFNLHLIKNVLGIANELSITLQRKDQDIS